MQSVALKFVYVVTSIVTSGEMWIH